MICCDLNLTNDPIYYLIEGVCYIYEDRNNKLWLKREPSQLFLTYFFPREKLISDLVKRIRFIRN